MGAAVRFNAVVLAGTRPGGDPFAQAMGVPYKAMVPAGGTALLRRVADTLRHSPSIERIVISGMTEAAMRESGQLAELLADPRIRVTVGAATPASSVVEAIDQADLGWPLLVTTGDHALLTPEMIDYFCGAAAEAREEVVVGMVDGDRVRARYPNVRRTFTRFREGTFKGTNLFALMSPASRRAPELWVQVEQYRKAPWRMVSFLGPWVLLRFVLRRLTLADLIGRIAAVMQVRIRTVLLPFPEAALDVDSEAHLAVAEEILRARAAAAG